MHFLLPWPFPQRVLVCALVRRRWNRHMPMIVDIRNWYPRHLRRGRGGWLSGRFPGENRRRIGRWLGRRWGRLWSLEDKLVHDECWRTPKCDCGNEFATGWEVSRVNVEQEGCFRVAGKYATAHTSPSRWGFSTQSNSWSFYALWSQWMLPTRVPYGIADMNKDFSVTAGWSSPIPTQTQSKRYT